MRIGIDLGGTKIEGVVLDDCGAECLRKRVDTPQSEGYSAILRTIACLVASFEASWPALHDWYRNTGRHIGGNRQDEKLQYHLPERSIIAGRFAGFAATSAHRQ